MKRSLISMTMLMWWLWKWYLDLKSLCNLIEKILCFDPVTCYLYRGNERQTLGLTWMIWRYLSDQEMIHHPRWIRKKKYYIYSQIVLTKKFLTNVEWDLKRVSNLIQTINDYYVENKHNLVWQTYYML
jgi:hypothetical protein